MVLVAAVAVTHPHIEHRRPGRVAAVLEVIEQARRAGHGHFRVAELAFDPRRDPPAQLLRHGLHAVADAEHRYAELIDRGRRPGRVCIGHRFGAAGEDHAARPEGAHLGVAHIPGMDFAVHAQFADAAGDELRVLRAEVEDQDAVVGRGRHRFCLVVSALNRRALPAIQRML